MRGEPFQMVPRIDAQRQRTLRKLPCQSLPEGKEGAAPFPTVRNHAKSRARRSCPFSCGKKTDQRSHDLF
jgi:hypothetical protein